MPEGQLRKARAIVTIPGLFLTIVPALADFNATHVTNPAWTGHARLHTVWLVASNSLVALLALGLLWHRRSELTRGRVLLAAGLLACVLGGFFLAAATSSLYGGTLTDPSGVSLRAGPLDANLAGFLAMSVMLIVALFFVPKPDR